MTGYSIFKSNGSWFVPKLWIGITCAWNKRAPRVTPWPVWNKPTSSVQQMCSKILIEAA